MARAYIYNAEFNPISFMDRIAPLNLYKEEYDKQQDAYYKLLEKTQDLAALKDIEMDRDSYQKYEEFKNQIDNIGEEMNRVGLTQDVKSGLLDLRRREIEEMKPLLSRQEKRAELIKKQQEYLKENPATFFDIDYSETPLSQITDSSTYKSYDINKITNDVATTVLDSMISNNGIDKSDIELLKDKYGYNEIKNENQRKLFDKVINNAKEAASAAYVKYQFKNYIDQTKAERIGRRTGIGYASTGKAYIKSPDGTAINITPDKNGNVIIKGYDGKERLYEKPDTTGMGKDEADSAEIKAYYSAYYGKQYDNTYVSRANPSHIIKAFKTDDGIEIMNRDGEFIPVGSNKQEDLERAYYGHDTQYLNSNNPPHRVKNDISNTKISIKRDSDIYGDTRFIDNINSFLNDNMLYDILNAFSDQYDSDAYKEDKKGDHNSWKDIFNSGAGIQVREILTKKHNHSGWDFTITKRRPSAQTPQTQASQTTGAASID